MGIFNCEISKRALQQQQNEKIAAIVEKNKEAIAAKVLADELVFSGTKAVAKEWDVNSEKVLLSIEKI